MALWGKDSNSESRPKSLPMDSNSTYSREFVTANKKGWVFQPGLASAATGNDNADAAPEILVCIRNLSVESRSANLLSMDFAEGAYADAALFDLVLTFDEVMTVTSAAATANQTITNKAYILLSELGATDMVSDSTVACQYKSGSGTNTLTFQGKMNTTDAGYLAIHDGFLHLDGTSTIKDADSKAFAGVAESDDVAIILDGSDGTVATINGAITTATTSIVVNTVSGSTIAVGQVVTVKGGAASITDDAGDTGVSTDMTLTITAVASQTAFTVSEPITVANDIVLNLQTAAGGKIELNATPLSLEGADGATDPTASTSYKTGFGVDNAVGRIGMLEEDGTSKIIMETDGDDGIAAEEYTTDEDGIFSVVQTGSTSGTATILRSVTTT
jgi:hypothetical protein